VATAVKVLVVMAALVAVPVQVLGHCLAVLLLADKVITAVEHPDLAPPIFLLAVAEVLARLVVRLQVGRAVLVA